MIPVDHVSLASTSTDSAASSEARTSRPPRLAIIASKGTIEELLNKAVEQGVQLIPCGMTIDVFGYFAKDANVTLFV